MTTVIDADGTITYISPSVERTLGYPPEIMLGRSVLSLLHPDDLLALRGDLGDLIPPPGRSTTHQARYRHVDGGWRWLEVINTNLLEEPGVGGVVSNAREVTETRELHDQLRYQASHDGLTGLANRRLFTERLAASTSEDRRGHEPVAVMLIDLDGFKGINDTLGHHVGDAVLVAVADRMRTCVRAGDTPGRLGGDEFAILLPRADTTTASLVARRFLALLEQPVEAHGHTVRIAASVGIVADDPDDPDALLRRADSAMYQAKRSGKNQYVCAVSTRAG